MTHFNDLRLAKIRLIWKWNKIPVDILKECLIDKSLYVCYYTNVKVLIRKLFVALCLFIVLMSCLEAWNHVSQLNLGLLSKIGVMYLCVLAIFWTIFLLLVKPGTELLGFSWSQHGGKTTR